VFQVFLVIILVGITAGNVWAIIKMMKLFSGEGCGQNSTWIIIMCILGIFIYIAPIFMRARPDASVLTSAILFSYIIYLQWSSLVSNHDEDCNPYVGKPSGTFLQIIFGLIFTFICLFIIAGTSSTDDSSKKNDNVNVAEAITSHMKEGEGEESKPIEIEGTDKSAEDTQIFSITPVTVYYQTMCLFASLYYGMLLCNWGAPTYKVDMYTDYFPDNNMSYVFKQLSTYFTIFMYVFTLLAPLCCKGRDF
jgi:hypothetical protein